jgi:hypothetical protein
VRDLRADAETGQRPPRRLEAQPLLAEQRIVGHVGSGEVGVDAGDRQGRAGRDRRHRAIELIVAEAEAVHAGVDLEVTRQPDLAPRRARLEGLRRRRRRHRRRQLVVEDPVDVADAERAEDQDRDGDAAFAQLDPFGDVGAGQHRRARGFERQPDAHRPVPVGVGFDHADDARPGLLGGPIADAAGGGAGRGDEAGEGAEVAGERVEVDAGEGRPASHGMQFTPYPARCSRTACTG